MGDRTTSLWPNGHPSREEQGTALILALFFAILALGIVFTGSLISKANRDKTRTSFRLNSQANQFARAGLTETMSWYRRQTTQPVVGFEPVIDTSVTPAILDTDEPDVGIVREYAIEGKIWGRYEVWKQWDTDPSRERLEWRRQMQSRDVSTERGMPMPGPAWRIRSVGYVFERESAEARFDERPNRVVAVQILEAEMLRRTIWLPGQAALVVGDGNSAHINTMGRIMGGANGAGIYYPRSSGDPTVGPKRDNRVTGSPPLAPESVFTELTCEEVLGVTFDELKLTADNVVTIERDFPVPVTNWQTIVVEARNFQFDATTPLTGKGLVYVKGNCAIAVGSNSNFDGLLFVEGNLTMRQPSEIRGAVIVTGNFTLQGATDYATIIYDDEVLAELRREFGNYSFLGAFRPIHHTR